MVYRLKHHIIPVVVIFVLLMVPLVASAQQQPTDQSGNTSGNTSVTLGDLVIAPDLFTRATDALDAKDYRRAELDFSLFILLNPTFSPAYYYRAQALQAQQEYDRAMQDLDQAVSTSQTFSDTYVSSLLTARGDLLSQSRRFDDALADYSRAISINNAPDALIGRGIVYYQQHDLEMARSDFDNAISQQSNNPIIYIYRATTIAQMNDTRAAAEDYLHFLDLIQTTAPTDNALVSDQPVRINMGFGVVHHMPFTAKAGQRLNALAAGQSASVDPLLVVTDSHGDALIADDDSGGSGAALIQSFSIPADDTYTLVVGHSLGGFDGQILVGIQLIGGTSN